jgi:predicted DNA-binding transcriptional regulator YafY
MNTQIQSAINNKKRIQFEYDGAVRIVEPYRYGRSAKKDKDLLRAFQLKNLSKLFEKEGWRLFDVSKISRLEIFNEQFHSIRLDYGYEDDAMIKPYYSEISR